MSKNDNGIAQININWYPGHMKKTREEISKLMPIIDFVIEIVDARMPLSSRIIDIEKIVRNKEHIIVMTKKDICDLEETNKWIKYYEENGEKVVLVDLKDRNDYKKLISKLNEISNLINEKRKNKGLKPKEPRALVFGVPNSGKSTFINTVAKKKIAKAANTPGFTKNLSWLKAGSFLLLDSPGMLYPKFESDEVALNLASMNSIAERIVPVKEVSYHILKKLNDYYPEKLKTRYGLDSLTEDIIKDYDVITKKLGIPYLNGEIDFDRVSRFILNDIRSSNISGITFDRR